LLWRALTNLFEHDRSAARGEMAARKLVVFKHDHPMGNAPAHQLFEKIKVQRVDGQVDTPARSFADYRVDIDRESMPAGVTLTEMF
jgi:CRISPR-associated protein Csd2